MIPRTIQKDSNTIPKADGTIPKDSLKDSNTISKADVTIPKDSLKDSKITEERLAETYWRKKTRRVAGIN